MDDDAFESIGAAAARVVMALGSGEESEPSASALGVKRLGRAHHDKGEGATPVVIFVNFAGGRPPRGARGPASSEWPHTGGSARQHFSFSHEPATGRCGNRVMRKL